MYTFGKMTDDLDGIRKRVKVCQIKDKKCECRLEVNFNFKMKKCQELYYFILKLERHKNHDNDKNCRNRTNCSYYYRSQGR